MAGSILTSILMSGVLAAAPGSDGFTFEGRQASARTEQPGGYFIQGSLPFSDLAERGTGQVSLSVQDRVGMANATFGDKAQLSASLRIGGADYRVELTQAGFPPAQAMARAPEGPLPRPPPHVIEGGVLMGVPLYGDSGIGWRATTRAHAAMAVWGIGSVWRNGALLTDSALVHVAALDAGTFADDDTKRILREARPGDAELVVVVWNLPPQQEPRGFLQFVFDEVSIRVDGVTVPSVAVVPSEGELPAYLAGLTPVLPTAFPEAVAPMSPPSFAPATQGTGGSGTVGTTSGTGPVGSRETTPATTTVPSLPSDSPSTFSGSFAPSAPTNPPAVVSGVAPGSSDTVGQGTFATPPTVGGVSVGGFMTPQVSALDFNTFVGTSQVSPGILATVPPLTQSSTTPPSPILGTPAPLNTGTPAPLLGTPAPLNSSPGTALPATPAPANAAPANAAPATGAPAAPAGR
ncbi:hypothetical protein D7Y13_11320 [Corallococcus praedator]|uniref:Uncharacterized protein n=1 Tax=Corallococcus praedator TaxID=2316724 RepID=A0ABX9QLE6_9BACT|nr:MULTISPECIES: hypothetical protein [Corallococcus]RKH29805.1 hypothetical protein D7X75_22255 [Corallococcus sp. CA031C]RKI11289.1 hypothetical protein D7Y13_11320 [Corallococcus praedator]